MEMFYRVKAFVCEGDKVSEIRKFVVDKTYANSFSYLKNKLAQIIENLDKNEFSIKWKDTEGDMITVCSDEELMLAHLESTNSTLNLYINIQKKVGALHFGIKCDGCDGSIRGNRYKCLVCPDFDLCKDCEMAGKHTCHKMIRLSKSKPSAKKTLKDLLMAKNKDIPVHLFDSQLKKNFKSPNHKIVMRKVRPSSAVLGRSLPFEELLKGCVSMPEPVEIFMKPDVRPAITDAHVTEDCTQIHNFIQELLSKESNKQGKADKKETAKADIKQTKTSKGDDGSGDAEYVDMIKGYMNELIPQILAMNEFLEEKKPESSSQSRSAVERKGMSKNEESATKQKEAEKTKDDVTATKQKDAETEKVKEKQNEKEPRKQTSVEDQLKKTKCRRSSGNFGWILIGDEDQDKEKTCSTASTPPPPPASPSSLNRSAPPVMVTNDHQVQLIPVTISMCPETTLTTTTTTCPVMTVTPPREEGPTENEIKAALASMEAKGYSNEGGWLQKLLEAKKGNIDEVLKAMSPFAVSVA